MTLVWAANKSAAYPALAQRVGQGYNTPIGAITDIGGQQHLIDYADKTLGVGQNLLDYPTAGTMNPSFGCTRDRRVLRVETVYNGQWRRIPEGIRTEDWSKMAVRSYPVRCERYAQLMLYPLANQQYTIRFWYVADLHPFTVSTDHATLDDEMILLHAVTNAKAANMAEEAKLLTKQLLVQHMDDKHIREDVEGCPKCDGKLDVFERITNVWMKVSRGDIADRFGFVLDPNAVVGELSVGERQRAEIGDDARIDRQRPVRDDEHAIGHPRQEQVVAQRAGQLGPPRRARQLWQPRGFETV